MSSVYSREAIHVFSKNVITLCFKTVLLDIETPRKHMNKKRKHHHKMFSSKKYKNFISNYLKNFKKYLNNFKKKLKNFEIHLFEEFQKILRAGVRRASLTSTRREGINPLYTTD